MNVTRSKSALAAAALAAALATNACATAPLGAPIIAAERPDQRAYALVAAYAAILEEAADILADPAIPPDFKRALAKAEAAASHAVAGLEAALRAYVSTRNIAALAHATAAAEAPVARFAALLQQGAPR